MGLVVRRRCSFRTRRDAPKCVRCYACTVLYVNVRVRIADRSSTLPALVKSKLLLLFRALCSFHSVCPPSPSLAFASALQNSLSLACALTWPQSLPARSLDKRRSRTRTHTGTRTPVLALDPIFPHLSAPASVSFTLTSSLPRPLALTP
eukprot:3187783-Pleurochrysis_carterae.AAC.1